MRNPRFHDAKNVHLDAVLYIPIQDPRAALTHYRTGVIGIAITLPSGLIDDLRRDFRPRLRLVRKVGLEYLAFDACRLRPRTWARGVYVSRWLSVAPATR